MGQTAAHSSVPTLCSATGSSFSHEMCAANQVGRRPENRSLESWPRWPFSEEDPESLQALPGDPAIQLVER